jgi:hypothetical protein
MTATDTLRTAEILREAGVPERQAAAHARAIDEAIDNLVTKDYLRATLYRARFNGKTEETPSEETHAFQFRNNDAIRRPTGPDRARSSRRSST